MRNFILLLFTGLLISMTSCRSDFEFQASSGNLKFSRDTVYLDTVFTNIGSSTYTLKVYNKSDKDIKIPTIQLGKGLDSKYRMMVDGMQGNNGKIFNDVELLAKDSMYIFIETTANIADANPDDFLYTDQILFDGGTNLQTVELVTLIQDAIFLYPQVGETIPIGEDDYYGFILDDSELTFTNEKPYVIYGLAAVGNGKTLTVEPGARVHFHDSSGIIVADGGTINVGAPNATPTPETDVVFEGDRLEPGFSDVPGQWFSIWLTQGSTGTFHNTTIKNATVGLYIQNNSGTVVINNTQIYDCSNFGILAQTATMTGENVVINTAGEATLACTLGGSYHFRNSTFNNNWASSKQVALAINDYYLDGSTEVPFPFVQAKFENCIIFGSNQRELSIARSEDATWTPEFTKCQIKYNNPGVGTLYEFIDDTSNIKKNGTPDFQDISKNKLMIGEDSAGNGFGDEIGVPNDILGNPRTPTIDLGAYQHIIFED